MPSASDEGVRLSAAVVRALPRLALSPPSRYRVFLAVLLAAARCREGSEARLSISDLAHLTSLAPRTVKAALADLRARGLVERIGRYRRLRILLPEPVVKVVPRSPTRRSTPESSRTFTARQEALIVTVLAEASTLLDADARQLAMRYPERVGLPGPVTYGAAYERLKGGAPATQLSAYVRAVLALIRDERIQGKELY